MILVTGATGFVGIHFINTLVEQHEDIRCLVRKDATEISKISQEIEIIKGDILDKDVVNNAVKGVKHVVHLAAMINAPDAEIINQVNLEGTKNMINASVRYGIEKFVFFSTLNIILPVKNQYSASKLACESIVKKSGLNYTILRPSIIYGKGDSGTIAKFVTSVKTKKTIFLFGDGECKIQPIYVCDVAKSICEVLHKPSKFENKTLFLVGRDVVSYNELVDLISDIYGVKCKKSFIPILIVKSIVKLVAKFSKKFAQFEDKLKTYQFDKAVGAGLQKDILPIQATPLKSGIAETIYLGQKSR